MLYGFLYTYCDSVYYFKRCMVGSVLYISMYFKPCSSNDENRKEMKTKNRYAFTLIELLVVIAIIILLASILLPTFFRARNKAMQVKCASNLKQIWMATSIYTDDNDDTLPIGGYITNTLTPPVMNVPTPAQGAPYRIFWSDILTNTAYLKTYQVLICPSAPDND